MTEYLTQVAYDKLTDELINRRDVLRQEITDRIATARSEGDLKENGGYHAAREEQGLNEARIKELEHRLENAEVGKPTDVDGNGKLEVSPGMLIEAEMSTLGKAFKFILGSRDNAEDGIDAFSPDSPLGSAIMGAEEGDTRSYKAPNGKEIEVKIKSIVSYA